MFLEERLTLNIADVAIGIDWDRRSDSLSSGGSYRDFLCRDEPEVAVTVHHGIPRFLPGPGDLVFDSQSHWKLFRNMGSTIVTLESPVPTPRRYCMAVFDDEFRHGDVYLSDSGYETGPNGSAPQSIDHTLMQILAVCLMSRGRGLMIHACGVDHEGRGYLFAGNSGHGKSTMAALWTDSGLILNDDRIVLGRSGDSFRIFGTPWHGTFPAALRRSVRLDKVFFLRHSGTNVAKPVTGASACSMLLARSFPPLWDREGMSFTLDLLSALVEEVRFYELGFLPSHEAVDFVLSLE